MHSEAYTFDFLIIDEASYIKEQAWRSAIQPTVLIRGKKVILCSTPRNQDFFYDMYQLGQSADHPNYESYRMTYRGNPFVNHGRDRSSKENITKTHLPSRV